MEKAGIRGVNGAASNRLPRAAQGLEDQLAIEAARDPRADVAAEVAATVDEMKAALSVTGADLPAIERETPAIAAAAAAPRH